MAGYTPEQSARLNVAVRKALRGAPRHRPSRFEKALQALGNVADDFEGQERDIISQAIQILTVREEGS